MRNYYKLFAFVIASILCGCNNQPTAIDYPDADAVFINLTKTFVLNEDGSIVQSVEKEQKLFTYRAFQSLLEIPE